MRSIVLLICLVFTQCRAKLMDLSCKEIKAFVDGHNNLRMKILNGKLEGQPPAASINLIVWDEELAEKAAKWASRNIFEHNRDKTVGSKRFTTGENLFWYYSTEKGKASDLANQACKSWADEFKDYKYGRISTEDFRGKKQIGHYTQMVWSKSTYLGCAISYFVKNNFNNYIVVCNYGPTGNYIGEYPYPKGKDGKGQLKCASGINCSKRYGNNC